MGLFDKFTLRRRSLLQESSAQVPVAMLEQLEPRLLLSSYPVIPSSYLDVGNQWNYDVHITNMWDTAVDIYTTMTKQIDRAENVLGYDTKVIESEMATGGYENQYVYLTDDYLVLAKYEDSADEEVLTVRNSNPAEMVFRTIGDTDNGRYVGLGEFNGYEVGDPGDTWTETYTSYQTYLGRETVTVAAGTFECIKVRYRTDWQDNEGNYGYQERTVWIDPDVGWIKGNRKNYDDWDEGFTGTDYEYDFSLTSYSLVNPVGGKVITGDFNDNLNDDLARLDPAGRWLVTTSQGNTELWGAWSTAVTWNDVQAADVNGDGKTDVIGRTDAGHWWAAISNGSSFTNQFMGMWAPISWNDVHAVNVNGDINGNTDIIGRTDSGAWWAGISNGSSFTNQFMGTWAAIPWNDVQAGDVNSDGKADMIGRTNSGAWWAAISNGSSFTNQFMGGWAGISWNDVQAADVNADGKTDIIGRTDSGAWWAAISNGNSFTNQFMGSWAPISWNDVQAADVNGDGKVDIIGRTDGGDWWAGVSNGSSFTNEFITTWSSAVMWVDVRVLDVNGDNEDDILGRILGSDVWWAAISDGGGGYQNQLWS